MLRTLSRPNAIVCTMYSYPQSCRFPSGRLGGDCSVPFRACFKYPVQPDDAAARFFTFVYTHPFLDEVHCGSRSYSTKAIPEKCTAPSKQEAILGNSKGAKRVADLLRASVDKRDSDRSWQLYKAMLADQRGFLMPADFNALYALQSTSCESKKFGRLFSLREDGARFGWYPNGSQLQVALEAGLRHMDLGLGGHMDPDALLDVYTDMMAQSHRPEDGLFLRFIRTMTRWPSKAHALYMGMMKDGFYDLDVAKAVLKSLSKPEFRITALQLYFHFLSTNVQLSTEEQSQVFEHLSAQDLEAALQDMKPALSPDQQAVLYQYRAILQARGTDTESLSCAVQALSDGGHSLQPHLSRSLIRALLFNIAQYAPSDALVRLQLAIQQHRIARLHHFRPDISTHARLVIGLCHTEGHPPPYRLPLRHVRQFVDTLFAFDTRLGYIMPRETQSALLRFLVDRHDYGYAQRVYLSTRLHPHLWDTPSEGRFARLLTSILTHSSKTGLASKLYLQQRTLDEYLTSHQHAAFLKRLGSSGHVPTVLRTLKTMHDTHGPLSRFVSTSLLHGALLSQDIRHALRIFDALRQYTGTRGPPVDAWNMMLDYLARYRRLAKRHVYIRHFLDTLLEYGPSPTTATYNAALYACLGRPKDVSRAQILRAAAFFREMLKHGLEPNHRTYNHLIIGFTGAGETESAIRSFHTSVGQLKRLPSRAVAALIVHLARLQRFDEAQAIHDVWQDSLRQTLVDRRSVWAKGVVGAMAYLKACEGVEVDVEQLRRVGWIEKPGFAELLKSTAATARARLTITAAPRVRSGHSSDTAGPDNAWVDSVREEGEATVQPSRLLYLLERGPSPSLSSIRRRTRERTAGS